MPRRPVQLLGAALLAVLALTLARYGLISKAQTIERAPEPKRTALEKASRTLARASRVLFTELERLEERKAALDPGAV